MGEGDKRPLGCVYSKEQVLKDCSYDYHMVSRVGPGERVGTAESHKTSLLENNFNAPNSLDVRSYEEFRLSNGNFLWILKEAVVVPPSPAHSHWC